VQLQETPLGKQKGIQEERDNEGGETYKKVLPVGYWSLILLQKNSQRIYGG
jgi:hypothetical protein